jgi:hypothetical protein
MEIINPNVTWTVLLERMPPSSSALYSRRILVIDDIESIHDVFRKILIGRSSPNVVPDKDADLVGRKRVLEAF